MKTVKLFFAGLVLACVSNVAIAESGTGVAHVVLVWLKAPGNAAHRQQIIEGTQELRSIPGVLDLQVGEVLESDRDVVEDSYDVGLYFRFASREALQAYLVHPLHKKTVKEQFVPIMDRYEVLDFSISVPPASETK